MNYNYVLKSNPFPFFGFRSFVPLWSASTLSGPFRGKRRDGASTLPRTKSKTYSTPALSVKPSITISPAQKLDCPSTLSACRLKPSDSLHLPVSDSAEFPSPLLDPPLLCVSSTLPVPALRLTPSPTSLCQGTYLDASGTRQPSPVARERRARSINISNTNIEPVSSKERSVNDAQYDVLESLMDLTHSALRGDCSRPYTEAHSHSAETQNSFLLHQKVDLVKKENSKSHKSKTPPRKVVQLEFLQNAVTSTQTSEPEVITLMNVQRKSQLAFDARPIHSGLNLHRKHRTAQTAGFGSKEPLQDHMCTARNVKLPATSLGSDSSERFWNQATVTSKLRQFNFNTAGNTDATLQTGSNLMRPLDKNTKLITGPGPLSRPCQQTSATQSKTSPQKHRLCPRKENTKTKMNVESTLSKSCSAVNDYCFRSKSEACNNSYLSQTKLYLLSPDQQQAVFPARCSASQSKCSKSNITACNQNMHLGQNKSHTVVTLSDMELNQKAEGPSELPECSSQSCVENWPLSVEERSDIQNGSGNKSNGAFDFLVQPQEGVYERAADTTLTASSLLKQPYYRRSDRVIFLEEDPHYVTMYHPGSVYVGE